MPRGIYKRGAAKSPKVEEFTETPKEPDMNVETMDKEEVINPILEHPAHRFNFIKEHISMLMQNYTTFNNTLDPDKEISKELVEEITTSLKLMTQLRNALVGSPSTSPLIITPLPLPPQENTEKAEDIEN